MELINTIILLLSTALPLIAAVITFIAKFVKSDKAKKAAENLLKINDAIEEFMVKAEKFKGYTGQEKKNYVLRGVKNYALCEEIEFDEVKTSGAIESLIEFSKSVNEKKKKESKTLDKTPANAS